MPCLKPHLLPEVINMAISTYKKNGREFFRVYVQARGKDDTSLRLQRKRNNIETLREAQKIEKKLFKAVIEDVAKIEGRGLTWGEIVDRWEIKARLGHLGDRYLNNNHLVKTHVNRLYKYTKIWINRRASDLTKGDGRQILNAAKADGAKEGLLKQIKTSVNVVFNWGIEEKYIVGTSSTPVEGLCVSDKTERVPQILTLEDIRNLLGKAREYEHPWYPIWAFAFLTGMRSGELKALQWKDLDFEKRVITVSKSYSPHLKGIKSTKAGYWRNVPISKDLEGVILSLKNGQNTSPEDFVLPRHYTWTNGQAGEVLRGFLNEIGISKDVVFHTLRACFATHMLAQGVDQATVMKIGGWRDIKTFQIYVRLAGVEVKGATDVLDVLPKMQPVTTGRVVNLSEYMEQA
jgi:integrase